MGKKWSFLITMTLSMSVIGLLAAITIPQFSAYRARSDSYRSGSYSLQYAYTPPMRISLSESSVYEDTQDFNTEEYDRIYENRFKDASQNPLSTFSIDVDTASYSNVVMTILSPTENILSPS
jgi:Ca-activated chloride channel family protein